MTIKDLKKHIEELESKHGEDCHVFISEQFVSGNTIRVQIRDMEKTDVAFSKSVSDTAAYVYSQFNEGIVIGFIPTVE